jgi:D-serine deaminase-like pyridoxal phosphate-dependent protein
LLIEAVLKCPALTLHGFYTHSGDAYASRNPSDGQAYLTTELRAVSAAATLAASAAQTLGLPALPRLVLAVGSTPTAHASARAALTDDQTPGATFEIHAGVYPLLDLQQRATGLVDDTGAALALGVLARVCSVYPERETPQVLIDAGAIALSKDHGPVEGYGEIYGAGPLEGWVVSKISQVSSCRLPDDARE